VEIIKDHRIENKWHRGFSRDQTFDHTGKVIKVNHEEPYSIVLHGTGGGDTSEGIIKWMLSGGQLSNGKSRKKQYKRGVALFHYLIDRRGKIVEIIDPDRWVFHSLSWTKDRFTIGIELVNPHPNNGDPYNSQQYESLFYLIFDHLFNKYPINTIVSHQRMAYKYSGKEKNCPGNFDYNKLEDELTNRDYIYSHNPNYESYWGIQKNE